MEFDAEQVNRHCSHRDWEEMGALGLLERNDRDCGVKCEREFRIQIGEASSTMCDHLNHYWSYCRFAFYSCRPSFCQLNFPAL